ncbi:MAG: class I SAM-dependent methyltransferase, partial [Rhodothermales bacterium]|nr:class I SAM-dependent methyltransferase [Rhodothermales bacterium]
MAHDVSRQADIARPYSALASIYDLVMEYVDYHEWADYVHSLVGRTGIEPSRLLELGCGTGSLAFELEEMLPACSYLATDGSSEMIGVARAKASILGSGVQFEVVDFTDLQTVSSVDFPLVLLLYDGINYLLTPSDVTDVLSEVRSVLASD